MKDIMTDANDKISEYDRAFISKVAKRACELYKDEGFVVDLLSMEMDLTVVHACCGGLRLEDLLRADAHNLIHDVCGIARHLNRETFELEDCFVPRFTARTLPGMC